MIRHLARLALLAASLEIFAMLLAPQPARAADPEPGLAIEVIYRKLYPGLKRHKALAFGPAGEWGYSFGYGSAAEAEQKALSSCLKDVRRQSWGKDWKCRLFAKNGTIVWKKPTIGVSLDETAPLPDIPLRRALQFWPKEPKLKGVVLALHGCNGRGPGGIDAFTDTWFRFFQSRGLLVVYPSSFDEQRPAMFCGWHTPETYQATTEAIKFRVAQTKRTIAELRKAHPGIPIYLWTHSEGGWVAQAINISKLSGIIIVGTSCGFGDRSAVMIPRSVPILHVFGEFDDTISWDEKTLSKSIITKICGPSSKSRSWVIAAGADHLTSLWRQNVIDAASRIIGQPSFTLAESKAKTALEGEARTVYENVYSRVGKTAFAIGPGGAYGIAAYWNNAEDTRQDALFQCARAVEFVSQNAPYPSGGRQPCRLYAIGNKVLTQ